VISKPPFLNLSDNIAVFFKTFNNDVSDGRNMDERYACYCGLYCENCAIKRKVNPAAKVLYNEIKNAGFDQALPMIPGGEGFWKFLSELAELWVCTSCREGSGDPECAVRICAKEKGMEMCAFCKSYPCGHIDKLFRGHELLYRDNVLLREKGMKEWLKMQNERCAKGFIYTHEK
jgi:hypothetical protein